MVPALVSASGKTIMTSWARRIFSFPKPATLARALRDAETDPEHPTWRAKVRTLPPLDTAPLRPAQIDAVMGVERALAEQHFSRRSMRVALAEIFEVEVVR